MDGCTRQDPAYRPATERPRFGGAFLFRDTRGVLRAVTIALLAATVAASPAAAAFTPTQDQTLGHEGRWVTDAQGPRSCVLHGFNMVYKRAAVPPDPGRVRQGRRRASSPANGFNTIRLGVIYAGVEPEPGHYDDAYLATIAKTERMLARHGHLLGASTSTRTCTTSASRARAGPTGRCIDDGMPAEPKNGFPANYLAMPALSRAYDHFWANDPGPGGVGLQDRYAAACRHVAEALPRQRRGSSATT